MEPFTTLTGVAVPLDRANVDTDQIIPKQFLKRIERTGFGPFCFFDWRYLDDGSPNPDFVLNQEGYQSASILIAGRNFGSGSSREHAPWALEDMGIKAILAPSYADIFFNNCFKNGMLPVVLPEETIRELLARATERPGYSLTVDLVQQVVLDQEGVVASFDVDPFRRECLLNGLDDIGLTLKHSDAICAFETSRNVDLPSTTRTIP
jgi:3-isopropylmalate/(R)-2-methylmalate dehydratase small subunit